MRRTGLLTWTGTVSGDVSVRAARAVSSAGIHHDAAAATVILADALHEQLDRQK